MLKISDIVLVSSTNSYLHLINHVISSPSSLLFKYDNVNINMNIKMIGIKVRIVITNDSDPGSTNNQEKPSNTTKVRFKAKPALRISCGIVGTCIIRIIRGVCIYLVSLVVSR